MGQTDSTGDGGDYCYTRTIIIIDAILRLTLHLQIIFPAALTSPPRVRTSQLGGIKLQQITAAHFPLITPLVS